MEITFIGLIVFVLALTALFFNRHFFVYYFMFFLPFTATAIINVKCVTFGLTPSYFFGMILLAGWSFEKLVKKEKVFVPWANKMLLGFLLVAVVSFLLPFIFQNHITVVHPEGGQGLLHFSRVNLTQLAYLLYVVFIIVYLTDIFMRKKGLFLGALRAFLGGGIFAVFWGWVQFFIISFHHPYPAWIFNNSLGMGQCWMQHMNDVPRICSVCPEPSMYTHFMMAFLPVLFFSAFSDFVCPRAWQRRFFLIVFLSGLMQPLMTLSTSAFFGIFIFSCLSLGSLVMLKKEEYKPQRNRMVIIFVSFVILSLSTVALYHRKNSGQAEAVKVFRQATVEKTTTFSGVTRINEAKVGLEAFKETFGLGTGWGSVRTSDLGTTLLGQVGLIGFFVFLFWIYSVLRQALTAAVRHGRNFNAWLLDRGLLIGFFCCLVVNFIAVPDIIFLYLAFLISALTAYGVTPSIIWDEARGK